MGRNKKGSLPPFKPLYNYVLKSPAWNELNAVERCTYLEIKRRYVGDNNGSIAVSVREVAQSLHVSKDTAARSIKRLCEIGFVVIEKPSGFNRKNRVSAEYRLTEEPNNLPGKSSTATKDFMKWGSENKSTVRCQGHHGPSGAATVTKIAQNMASQSDVRDRKGPTHPANSPMSGTLIESTIQGRVSNG